MEVEQGSPKYPKLFLSISPIQLGRGCLGSGSPEIEPEARIFVQVIYYGNALWRKGVKEAGLARKTRTQE